MKVFISWSAERSQGVASALHSWLPQVIQSVEPFMSATMDPGVKWNEVIAQNLDQHDVGILCVTPENVDRPWLNYEAGALSRSLDDRSRVIPYLSGFTSAGDLPAPLNQFNAVLADQAGTWKVIRTLDALGPRPRGDGSKKAFDDYWWPQLRAKLEEVSASDPQPPAQRPDSDKLDELLENTRQLLRRGTAPDYNRWLREATRRRDEVGASDDTRRLAEAAVRIPAVRDVLAVAAQSSPLTVDLAETLLRAAGPSISINESLKKLAGPSEWAAAFDAASRGQGSIANLADHSGSSFSGDSVDENGQFDG